MKSTLPDHTSAPRRVYGYRPCLESLEARLTLGETLGLLLGCPWIGTGLDVLHLAPEALDVALLHNPPASRGPSSLPGLAAGASDALSITPSDLWRDLLSPNGSMETAGGFGQSQPAAEPGNGGYTASDAGLLPELDGWTGLDWAGVPPRNARPSSASGIAHGASLTGQGDEAGSVPVARMVPSTVEPAAAGVVANATSRGEKTFIPREPAAPPVLPASTGAVTPASQAQIQSRYGQLPLSFEANRGQTDPQVQFLTHGAGYSLFLTATEAVMVLSKPAAAAAVPRGLPSGADALAAGGDAQVTASTVETTATVVRTQLVGANPTAQASGVDQLPGTINYFLGSDPARWHTNIPTYRRVAYQAVYPGIDLVYYGSQQQLEYDFVIAPGADPSAIRLAVRGAEGVALDAQGNLVLHTAGGDVMEHAPVLYQDGAGGRQPVAGRFVLVGPDQVGFVAAGYDRSRPLVIDPVLGYSTYLGGSSVDQGYRIAVDGAGNAYITGESTSVDFPTTTGAIQTAYRGNTDAFVTKVNASGTAPVYSTYLGGTGVDYSNSIAVDGAGSAYVTGYTTSTNFPTANPLQRTNGGGVDAFVSKLNAAGTALVYSTYLGGTSIDYGTSIAVDGAGNAYVTGFTASTNFPTANPLQRTNGGGSDAFVSKLNAAGIALVYSTYLGGASTEDGIGIAVDGVGNAYVTGITYSTNFPTANPLQRTNGGGVDAFVSKLNAAGTALVYSTYLGGASTDYGAHIAVDGAGNAYITGYTTSTNFPTADPLQPANGGGQDAFVAKLNAAGTALVYSTYLGGTSIDYGTSIAVDGTGNAYVTGYTTSTNFPTADPSQSANGGGQDAFVAKLNATGAALVYSTYLGGSLTDSGEGVAVDSAGNAYVTGLTGSADFPTTAGAFQTAYGGGTDAFVVKISPWDPLTTLAPGPIGTMLLLSDGTVLAQNTDTNNPANRNLWYSLTPDPSGSYVNGTWGTLASMNMPRLYYGSNVLPDGRVLAVGGEYTTSNTAVWTNTGEIYDSVSDAWRNIANFPQPRFGDVATEVLPNGNILAGYLDGPQTYFYNPTTDTWSAASTKLNNDQSSEENWVKLPASSTLPQGGILSYDIHHLGTAQVYNIATNIWVATGPAPNNLSDSHQELGPGLLLPDGRVFYLGATGHTAYYTPSTNSWMSGPDIPNHLGADDAPAAVLPNGKILFAADTPPQTGPTNVIEFDPNGSSGMGTYMDVTPFISGMSTGGASFADRMLVLPTGQILFTTGGTQLAVYNPDGTPAAGSTPAISLVTSDATLSRTGRPVFDLYGQRLNGSNEGAAYGDDAEMSSNYPIVQITDAAGNVSYARTHNWSNTGVAATGTVSTQFDLPAGVTVGQTYTVRVIANGVASDPYKFSLGSTLLDHGFEVPHVGTGSDAYQFQPAASPWTFIGAAGVAGNGSVYTAGNPDAPQGTQVAFVEYSGQVSQTFNVPGGGSYTLSFRAAQRGNGNASRQTIQVTVDNTVRGTFTPSGTAYQTITVGGLALAPGLHTVTFAGTDPDGGDNTALIDLVQLGGAKAGRTQTSN